MRRLALATLPLLLASAAQAEARQAQAGRTQAVQTPAGQTQAGPRTLDVPARAGWQHAATGLILPARPIGTTRSWLRDSGTAEQDVMAEYKDEAAGLSVTVYIFQAQLPDAAIWFDRALETIRALPEWGVTGAARPTVARFAPPGATATTGLITGFDVAGRGQRGTALAVAALPGWLVKVRMSSTQLGGAATAERLRAFVAALRWPNSAGATPAAPIEDCPRRLVLKKARVIKPDLGQSLIGGLMGAMSTNRTPVVPSIYCRDATSRIRYSVYRANASENSYILAMGDAGFALSLQPTINLEDLQRGGRTEARRWSMSLLGRTSVGVLPMFNRLPPPEQAFTVAAAGGPNISLEMKKEGN